MILVALVLGAAYLASRPGSDMPAANGQRSAPKFAAIERFVRGEMAAQRIPGLALGIIENDRITYLRGFGKADDSGRPVTPKTPFIIGSLSKSFTATGDHAARRGREGRARRPRAALPAVVPRRGRGSFRADHRPPPPEPDERPVDQDRPHVPGQRRHQRRRAREDGSQAEQRRADGTGRQDPSVQHHQLLGPRADRADRRRTLLRELRPDGDPRPAADARLVHVRGGGRATRPRDRLPLLVRPAESGRPPLQPWARPGRLPDLRRRGHDPLPDRPAEQRSLRLGVRALA